MSVHGSQRLGMASYCQGDNQAICKGTFTPCRRYPHTSFRVMTTRHGKAFLNPNKQCRSVYTKFQPCLTLHCQSACLLAGLVKSIANLVPFLAGLHPYLSDLGLFELYTTWRSLERTGGQTAYSSTGAVKELGSYNLLLGDLEAKYLLRIRHLIPIVCLA